MTQLYYYNQIIKLSADFELTDFESFRTVFLFSEHFNWFQIYIKYHGDQK